MTGRETANFRYRFAEVELDSARLAVSVRGEPRDLEPKAIRVLLHLIEHRDRVVTKEELFGAVWAGAEVGDNALTRVIGQLRKALGDDARQARFIETVPTVGYRFVAEVEAVAPERRASGQRGWARRLVAPAIACAGIAVAGILIVRPRDAAQPLPPAARVRQITNSTGLDAGPTISPDGRLLAYSSDKSGQLELYVRPFDEGGRELQITNDGGGSVEADWSPDGKTIAFHCISRGGICLAPALGGPVRQLTRFGSQPVWSPDGRTLVFRSMRMVSPAPYDVATVFPSELWLVDADSGQTRKLSRPGENYTTPSFSGDGRWVIATALLASGGTSIQAIDVQTGAAHTVHADTDAALSPVVSPDGRALYFCRFVKADRNGIFRLPLDPARLTPAGDLVEVFASREKIQNLRASRDGRMLVASQVQLSSNLWRIDPDAAPGAQPVPLTNNTNERNTVPAFSGDGEWVAYHTRRFGQPAEVWRVRPDGRDAELVHSAETGSFGPQWLPGSRELLMLTGNRRELIRFSFDDRQPRLLKPRLPDEADRAPVGYPRLSPDGRHIYLHGRAGSQLRVGVFGWTDGSLRWLTSGEPSIGFASPSGDGRALAVEVLEDYSSHLGILPTRGGAVRMLTSGLEQAWPYSWSADSRRIAFAGQRAGTWNIWSIDVASGAQRRLTDYRSARWFVRYPAWSPRGGALVFEASEVRGNVFALDLPR